MLVYYSTKFLTYTFEQLTEVKQSRKGKVNKNIIFPTLSERESIKISLWPSIKVAKVTDRN